ncbi:MAG: YbbR-like domain-containing protein [bacterium]
MRRLFAGNLPLKIASVLIAIGLWFFINSRGVSEITITVPLEIMNLPKGYETVSNKAVEIDLGLRGHERLIKNIRAQDIRVFLDLSKPKEGWAIYYINKDNIKYPPSVDIIKIDPSSVKLKIDKTIQRDVPVTADLKGSPGTGFTIGSVSLKPKIIRVEGAKTILEKIQHFRTEPLDLTGKTASFEEEASVIIDGENLRPETDRVRVKVRISRRTE